MYRGEWFNTISHLVGATLALVGATVLVTLAALEGNVSSVASVTVYGVTLVCVYLASTLYHGVPARLKDVFRRLDHGAIYLVIAGTWTPFAAIALEPRVGIALLVGMWCLALAGLVVERLPIPGPRVLPVTIYLLMGWSAMFVLEPLRESLAPATLGWLVAGGVVYTLGVVFFALDYLRSWLHGVWHLFVIAGSACHYVAVLSLVGSASDAVA